MPSDPTLSDHSTIAAPITAPGRAAVQVVRVSGPDTGSIIERLLARSTRVLRAPRELVFTAILDTLRGDQVLDHAMAVLFPAPNSFTGEDCLELHLHGGTFILERLLENLQALGVRLARPGEFSERAFLNGRMDLSQAEAVADLINAETEAQAKVAREQLEGALSQAVSELGLPLRELLAEVEAHIDFPEEDIESYPLSDWGGRLAEGRAHLTRHLDSYRTGRLYREGAVVVLAGVPNAGKSSLLNALMGEERVIVTAIPGTTRDAIETHLSIEGMLLRVWDTAGLADGLAEERTLDLVEQLGIERSWKKIEEADLLLFLVDPLMPLEPQCAFGLRASEKAQQTLCLINKADVADDAQRAAAEAALAADLNSPALCLSAKTGRGLKELHSTILERLFSGPAPQSSVLVSNRRHYEQLHRAAEAVDRAGEALATKLPLEFLALELRAALGAFDEIIGVTTTEDVLGLIFSKFCIGK